MSRTAPIFIVLLLILAGVQYGCFPMLGLGDAAPSAILVWVVAVALARGVSEGAIVGFAAGFVEAAMTREAIGAFLVSRTLVGALCGMLRGSVFVKRALVAAPAAFAATLIANAAFVLISPPQTLWPAGWPWQPLESGLLNAVLAPFVGKLALAIDRRFPSRLEG